MKCSRFMRTKLEVVKLAMTNNERKILLALARMSGKLMQTVSHIAYEQPTSEAKTKALNDLDAATAALQEAIEMMAKEWDTNG